MDLNGAFQPFVDAIANVTLFQRVAGAMVRAEVESLQKFKAQVDSRPTDDKDIFKSFHAIHYPDPRSWELKPFHRFDLTPEDRLKNVVKHKQKQYQWLFAEAFEAYEKFLDRAYAYAAIKDRNFWPLKDYGNISLSEVSGLDFAWHLAQTLNKRDRPDSLLGRFRRRLPIFASEEQAGGKPANFKLAISLSEQIRHHVVHAAGNIADVAGFREKVLKRIGTFNNGSPANADIQFIDMFLAISGNEAHVSLIELRFTGDVPFAHYNRFEILIGYIMSHGILLRDNLATL